MAKYKVIALSVGGKGNKIFNGGDVVTDKNFPEGNAEELVQKGFLELLPDGEQTEEEETAEEATGADTSEDSTDKNLAETKEVITVETFTKKELQEKLTLRGIVFGEKDNKQTLFDLLPKD